MGSKSPSRKGDSKSSHTSSRSSSRKSQSTGGGTDKVKTAKLAFAGVVLAAVPAWLLYYYDPFDLRKPAPAPAPDAFIEQLPEPERERARKQAERTQEILDSGEQVPAAGSE